MKAKIFVTVAALTIATAAFSQSDSGMTDSHMKSSSKMNTHRKHARTDSTGAGDISSPGNSSSSNGHVTSNGTNGLDRTTGNGTWNGNSHKKSMKAKNKSKMTQNSADSTQ